MIFSAEHKELIERQTLDVIATALDRNELTEAGIPPISRFILNRIDSIHNTDELILFLQDLSVKWPMFKGVLDIEKGKLHTVLEKKAVSDISTLTHNGNIEEAIHVAKSATQT